MSSEATSVCSLPNVMGLSSWPSSAQCMPVHQCVGLITHCTIDLKVMDGYFHADDDSTIKILYSQNGGKVWITYLISIFARAENPPL